jgi:hypothetical protein
MPDCGIVEQLHIVQFDDNKLVVCSNCRQRLGLDGRNGIDRSRFPTSIFGCVICAFADPRCWEVHHIDGQSRSDRCTALCLVHHEIVTEIQKDDRLTDGIADILLLRREQTAQTENPLPSFLWWHETDKSTVFEIADPTYV